jgi:hypothetical protein
MDANILEYEEFIY